jgi:hypothetical protein
MINVYHLTPCSLLFRYFWFRSDKRGSVNKGLPKVDLFVKQVDGKDGKKVLDPKTEDIFCSNESMCVTP